MVDGGQQHAGEGRMSEGEAALQQQQQQREANLNRLKTALNKYDDDDWDLERGRDDDAAVALIQELGLEQLTPLHPRDFGWEEQPLHMAAMYESVAAFDALVAAGGWWMVGGGYDSGGVQTGGGVLP